MPSPRFYPRQTDYIAQLNAMDASFASAQVYAVSAQNWATSLTTVDGTSYYGARYYAQQAAASASTVTTGVTAAQNWATSLTLVDGTYYGARKYATDASNSASSASTSATAAQNWATSLTQVDGTNYGAKKYATDAATSASNASSSANTAMLWATSQTKVDGTYYGASYYAIAASGSASSAATSATNAQNWATSLSLVDGTNYGAKKYASDASGSATAANTSAGNAATSAQNASDWAIKTSATVDGTNYSAKYYAQQAAASASAATSGQIQVNWLQTDNTQKDFIRNKPTIPTAVSQLSNDSGYLTSTGTAAAAAKLSTARQINGFAFDGSQDITITKMPSGLFVTNGNDLTLSASSGTPNDPGDIIFQNGSGSEMHRIYDGGQAGPTGTLTYRSNGGTGYALLHQGNLATYGLTLGGGTLTGNLGIGLAPLTSDTNFRSIEIGGAVHMGSVVDGSSFLTKNAYYAGAWKYRMSGTALMSTMESSGMGWYIAASGTSGAAISWSPGMYLNNAGSLLLGTTTDDGSGSRFQVTGASRLNGNLTVLGTSYLANVYASNSVFVNGASAYSAFSSAMTINYTGNGSQYGVTMKPNTSTADTAAVSFLNSGSTTSSASAMAQVMHMANDAGINLTGNWFLGTKRILTTADLSPGINMVTAAGSTLTAGLNLVSLNTAGNVYAPDLTSSMNLAVGNLANGNAQSYITTQDNWSVYTAFSTGYANLIAPLAFGSKHGWWGSAPMRPPVAATYGLNTNISQGSIPTTNLNNGYNKVLASVKCGNTLVLATSDTYGGTNGQITLVPIDMTTGAIGPGYTVNIGAWTYVQSYLNAWLFPTPSGFVLFCNSVNANNAVTWGVQAFGVSGTAITSSASGLNMPYTGGNTYPLVMSPIQVTSTQFVVYNKTNVSDFTGVQVSGTAVNGTSSLNTGITSANAMRMLGMDSSTILVVYNNTAVAAGSAGATNACTLSISGYTLTKNATVTSSGVTNGSSDAGANDTQWPLLVPAPNATGAAIFLTVQPNGASVFYYLTVSGTTPTFVSRTTNALSGNVLCFQYYQATTGVDSGTAYNRQSFKKLDSSRILFCTEYGQAFVLSVSGSTITVGNFVGGGRGSVSLFSDLTNSSTYWMASLNDAFAQVLISGTTLSAVTWIAGSATTFFSATCNDAAVYYSGAWRSWNTNATYGMPKCYHGISATMFAGLSSGYATSYSSMA